MPQHTYLLYTRKSTDDGRNQQQSLYSQRTDLLKFAQDNQLQIVEMPPESMSARKTGRPIFNEMVRRLQKGEAQGILSWHPDRLARNPIDGGVLIDLLDHGQLADLKFTTYTFENTPEGKLMLAFLLAQSKHYVDSLSRVVRRGMVTKVQNGWYPGRPPVGYINDPISRTIIPDPERFKLVRKLWDAYLTGESSLNKLSVLARNIGLRARPTKRHGVSDLTISSIYDILKNPFYVGFIAWGKERQEGKHLPMVTHTEFKHVQKIMEGRRNAPRPSKLFFPYRGFMRCGSCGRRITAEVSKKPNKNYTYYRCTRLRRGCAEPRIERERLENQVHAFISSLTVPRELYSTLTQHLDVLAHEDKDGLAPKLEKARKDLESAKQALATLVDLRCRDLVNDAEFTKMRIELLHEQSCEQETVDAIEQQINNPRGHQNELAARVSIVQDLERTFTEGTDEQRHEIVRRLCSNVILKDRTARFSLISPLDRWQKRSYTFA